VFWLHLRASERIHNVGVIDIMLFRMYSIHHHHHHHHHHHVHESLGVFPVP